MLTVPGGLTNDQMETWEALAKRVLTLDERSWAGAVNGPAVVQWLGNFRGDARQASAVEQLHALYMLSQFMYFGAKEIRVLLKSLYRDLFFLPLAHRVKSRTSSYMEFHAEFEREIFATRFLGVGNPSESGVHLLYYFRQENGLSKDNFLDSAQLYKTEATSSGRQRVVRHGEITRYVFIDDMCGSGETATRYSKDLLPDLVAQKPDVELHYLCLFASKDGLDIVRNDSVFGPNAEAIFELDDTYKWAFSGSRYKNGLPPGIESDILDEIARKYGGLVWPGHPLGFGGGELLLGFFHNTPDNTLPIIWGELSNGSSVSWSPIFRRYPKV